jgi:hypothetical protein
MSLTGEGEQVVLDLGPVEGVRRSVELLRAVAPAEASDYVPQAI